jgi:protein-disulfide isomerase/uncharacterized membrane protein
MLTARRTFIAALCLAAAAGLSVALLLKHFGVGTPVDALCGIDQTGGCDIVNRSSYSQLLGIPLAAIGLVVYVSLAGSLLLSLFAGERVRAGVARMVLTVVGLSLLVDAGLLWLQATQLHAYCVLCILTYVAGASAFGALLTSRRADVGQTLGSGEGRLVAAGWLVGSLSAVITVAVYQTALSARPASPTAILGGNALPTPAASAGPAAGAGGEEGARREVQRLQAILDDPQKLEQYYSEKAVREFELSPVETLDLGGVPFKGPSGAPIRVVEYSDFLCPFCKSLAEGFKAYLPQTQGRVAIFFKNYPLDTRCNENLKQQLHDGSCVLALGGLCAADQNRFWEYHDRVFAREQRPATHEDAVKLASEAGLDPQKLSACIDQPATMDRLRAQIKEGNTAGVKATPTVLINGRRVTRLNDFILMIDKESARLGLQPLPPPQAPQAAR